MSIDPAACLALHNQGVAHFRSGRVADACNAFREAVRLAGEKEADVQTLKALWRVARIADDWKTALAAGIRAAIRDPHDFPFVRNVLDSVRECPPKALFKDPASQWLDMPVRMPSLSVIIVSQDDERYAAADAEYAKAFARWPHERIRVKGASSMYDGYAQGFARSTGDVIVFSHDDVHFATPDFAARLADVMSTADIAGIAGTTNVTGPALRWSGHPHLYGAVTHRESGDDAFEFALSSFVGPRIPGAQGLDGVFIAARREWVERIGFDPEGVPGFHFYDLDFTYRGHRAGARVTIACDLAVIHRSRGQFDARWQRAQQAFHRKFPHLSAPPGAHGHWYTVRLPDADSVTLQYAKLWAAWGLRVA